MNTALREILERLPRIPDKERDILFRALRRETDIPEWKKTYFISHGQECPFCGSDDIRAGCIEADGMTASAEVICGECGALWQDLWTLVDIQPIDRKET